jgi:hypothetical protein
MQRRQFLRRVAVTTGGLASFGLLETATAFGRATGDAKPIPGGFNASFELVAKDPLVHVLPPAIGFEMSTIGDFKGVLGAAEIQGTARGSDGTVYSFDTDMRFMQGTYVDLQGRVREGSFGFI